MSRISGILKRRAALPLLRRFSPERAARVNGFQLRVNLRDHIIGTRLWTDGSYEPETLSLIESMDLSGKVCVDVGANLGLHTLAMSKRAAQVYAFEPERYNFQLLSENIKANDRKNVAAEMCALGDAEGKLFLSLCPFNLGDHRISTKGQQVSVTTGDMALKDTADNSIGLIKVDVQGYECHVLRGLSQTLARNPDVTLLIELFPEGLRQAGESPSSLIALLKELGFDGYEIHPHRTIPLLDASAYETIIDGKDVNLIISRKPLSLPVLHFSK